MTTLPPLAPAARRRFTVLAIIGGALSLVGVLASSVVSRFVDPCTTQAECLAATEAFLGPTLALAVGPVLIFLVGGVVALVLRGRRHPGFWIAALVTVVLQAVWIVGWFVAIAQG